jgi:hypothetical protein
LVVAALLLLLPPMPPQLDFQYIDAGEYQVRGWSSKVAHSHLHRARVVCAFMRMRCRLARTQAADSAARCR